MAVPKKKTSKARRDRRRAHHDIVAKPSISNCAACGSSTRPHQVCSECGVYRGRQVLKIETEEAQAE